ncbi:hypothetical protein FNF29_05997 [Cafeteria roenbergensis]|uniref:Protein kinase domain-containing protein n=1 Tax=Cafeteria roenbergensis TaxID=33653 RepID=A0A5A8CAE1_CAFRO|nr:hypothetical protein FNF29_05997 [Cafeteria roenbergensis]|eukprot:KAA0149444.1 hypothetical protein FNF29_05997 [Cafeteria roenbergensis]
MLKTLSHPNLVDCLTSFTDVDRDKVVFVMPKATNDVAAFLRTYAQDMLAVRFLRRWVRQILEGLAHLHAQHPPIIHRDIKPENLLYNSSEGVIRIADFGIAISSSAATPSSMSAHGDRTDIQGTPNYMPPEAFDGTVDPSMDIYALGMTVVNMATGVLPFNECGNVGQIYNKLMQNRMPAAYKLIRHRSVRDFVKACVRIQQPGPDGTISFDPDVCFAHRDSRHLPDHLRPGSSFDRSARSQSHHSQRSSTGTLVTMAEPRNRSNRRLPTAVSALDIDACGSPTGSQAVPSGRALRTASGRVGLSAGHTSAEWGGAELDSGTGDRSAGGDETGGMRGAGSASPRVPRSVGTMMRRSGSARAHQGRVRASSGFTNLAAVEGSASVMREPLAPSSAPSRGSGGHSQDDGFLPGLATGRPEEGTFARGFAAAALQQGHEGVAAIVAGSFRAAAMVLNPGVAGRRAADEQAAEGRAADEQAAEGRATASVDGGARGGAGDAVAGLSSASSPLASAAVTVAAGSEALSGGRVARSLGGDAAALESVAGSAAPSSASNSGHPASAPAAPAGAMPSAPLQAGAALAASTAVVPSGAAALAAVDTTPLTTVSDRVGSWQGRHTLLQAAVGTVLGMGAPHAKGGCTVITCHDEAASDEDATAAAAAAAAAAGAVAAGPPTTAPGPGGSASEPGGAGAGGSAAAAGTSRPCVLIDHALLSWEFPVGDVGSSSLPGAGGSVPSDLAMMGFPGAGDADGMGGDGEGRGGDMAETEDEEDEDEDDEDEEEDEDGDDHDQQRGRLRFPWAAAHDPWEPL